MRSDAPVHPDRSPINVHEGRVCRASALAASAAKEADAVAPAAPVAPSAPLNDFGYSQPCSCYGATAASADPPATAPNDASPPRNPGAAPRPQQERSVCVTDNVEAVEGQRGGGWGDLDGFPETITIARHEHPTSRRGGDRDTARAAYMAAAGDGPPPRRDLPSRPSPEPAAGGRSRGAQFARGGGGSPAPSAFHARGANAPAPAPRGRCGRR